MDRLKEAEEVSRLHRIRISTLHVKRDLRNRQRVDGVRLEVAIVNKDQVVWSVLPSVVPAITINFSVPRGPFTTKSRPDVNAKERTRSERNRGSVGETIPILRDMVL